VAGPGRGGGESLSLGKIGGAGSEGRTAGYYTASVARGRDDYYSGKGEAPGEWFGQGAEGLGLVGEVDPDEFQAVVMEASDPRRGERLRRQVGEKPVQGMDMTFSAPKSASLLFFLGDERTSAAVRQAHDEAVGAALGYMEREACVVRVGKGGRGGKEAGEGFVGGLFRHRTSRALDPQLHTHAVVANLAKRSDGRYIALDATAMFQQARTGGCLYQAELRARLTEYAGVEWGPVRNGMAEIKGIPRPVIEHFSKRRAQIVEAMAGRRSATARSAQEAALETRPEKQQVDLEQLVSQWRSVAAELGFGRADLENLTGRLVERPQPGGEALRELAGELAGPRGLTRQASTFDRRSTVQAFSEAHAYGATVARLEHLADRFLESGHVLALEGEPAVCGPDTIRRRDGRLIVRVGGAKYTTPEMLEREARLVSSSSARKGEGAGRARRVDVAAVLAKRPGLAEEQAVMVRALTRSGDGVQVVRAAAGTGKTYALDAAREAWEACGFRVVGATLSARAACELRDTGGIDAATVAQVLMDLDRGYQFSERNVVVVDEAGMVGTRDLEQIASACEATGAKLVLVGDDRQLPEIDAGGAFRGLAVRLGALGLREVRRQREVADRAALRDLREGRPAEWLRSADERGQLVVERGAEAQYERLVSDWWHGRERLEEDQEAMILTPTREAASELNERARAYMRQAGRLGERALQVGGQSFAAGDRVMCLKNARRDIGVLNGLRGTVTAVEDATVSLRVEIDGQGEVVLPGSYIEDGNVALGYAMTVHKSQGMTAERTYVLGSEELYRELGYTALSRHRESCRFYLNAGEPSRQLEFELAGEQRDQVLERIERALGRSRAQEMALEVHERDEDLRRLSDAELARRAGRLEELLASYPSAARDGERQAAELARCEEALRRDEQRLGDARERREALGRFDRSGRAELDEQIARQRAVLAKARARQQELTQATARAQALGEEWLERNGVELAEATTIERELASRRTQLHEEAIARGAHEPASDLRELLGERPNSLLERDRWDHAAAALAGYRARYGELPGPDEPSDGPRRRAWEHTQYASAQVHELGRTELDPPQAVELPEPPGPQPDIDLGP
jgi:conjugative relaxase-like TrwC/TraI family protein